MLLSEVVHASRTVGATPRRSEKKNLLATFLRAVEDPGTRSLAASYLAGEIRQAKLNVGYAQLREVEAGASVIGPAATSLLTLANVDASLTRIAQMRGQGSVDDRQSELARLFARASEDERAFLFRLLMGELRQGAQVKLLLEAVAQAAAVEPASVRSAHMTAGSLAAVVQAAFEGEAALAALGIRLFVPVNPMLAGTGDTVEAALSLLGRAAWEWKLDGARVQVHMAGAEVRVFSRALNDVTAAVPEIVIWASALPARELILDGEVLALDRQGRPLAFQTTMRRFGRKVNVRELRAELPLSPFAFDLLWLDGVSWLGRNGEERARALAEVVPAATRVPRLITTELAEAQAFYDQALAAGHEGVVAKSLTAPYRAGTRDVAWLKVKKVHTLDLVVLAAEWGSGRRRGYLSNLHLGARADNVAGNGNGNGFVMLGKTFKGLTDALLAWQTEALLARKTHEARGVVFVRPELVVEIAFNDVQVSPHYPGKVALRFARVKRYRPDKQAAAADTLATVTSFVKAAPDAPAAQISLPFAAG